MWRLAIHVFHLGSPFAALSQGIAFDPRKSSLRLFLICSQMYQRPRCATSDPRLCPNQFRYRIGGCGRLCPLGVIGNGKRA
jgi:hypothetical protein